MHDTIYPAPETHIEQSEIEFAKSFHGPRALDFLVTIRCQMACQICFAPQDQIPEISCLDWQRLIYLSHLMGTGNSVFTGGEPLLVEFLPDLLRLSKELGQTTTLSTNAILFLEQHRRIMHYVDELGIPIDGFNPTINALTRQPNGETQFGAAVEAVKLALAHYPNVMITVRTVVTAQNFSSVLEIPDALSRQGIDLSKGHIRWKLYQFNPIGEQFDQSLMDELCISLADFLVIWSNLRNTSYWFECYPVAVQEGTYAIVYPNGSLVTAVPDTGKPNPYDFPLFQYKVFGNLCTEFVQTMREWEQWRLESEGGYDS